MTVDKQLVGYRERILGEQIYHQNRGSTVLIYFGLERQVSATLSMRLHMVEKKKPPFIRT